MKIKDWRSLISVYLILSALFLGVGTAKADYPSPFIPYSSVSPNLTSGKVQEDVKPPNVIVTIAKNPTDEDKDWPIVGAENQTFVDPLTGKTFISTVTIRRPSDFKPSNVPCPKNDLSKPISTTAYCFKIGPESRRGYGTKSGVSVYIVHYADKYCLDDSCSWTLYKPTRVEVYWKRTSTKFNVQNAVTRWGCWGCNLCDTRSYYYIYDSGPFTPLWQNSTTSYTYVYTTTPQGPWPPLYPRQSIWIQAVNNSKVYQSGSYVGDLEAGANYTS